MLFRVVLTLGERSQQDTLAHLLQESGVVVKSLPPRGNLLNKLGKEACDMFVLDAACLGDQLEDTITSLRGLPETPYIALITTDQSAGHNTYLWGLGCDLVLFASIGNKPLVDGLLQALSRREDSRSRPVSDGFNAAQPTFRDFVSNSPSMVAFMDVVQRTAKADTSLLVLGETGVGKERLARAIHTEGKRGEGPFIAINCAALPESLLESELFGHEMGAFTGATRARRGAFELAHGGTIFLDEIGEMPLPLQSKLLRVLQEREFARLGSESNVKVDVRVITATNRDLKEEVAAGRFRQDLYYRIGVITLTIPPLRERAEDIEELVTNYVGFLGAKLGVMVDGIEERAMQAMIRYDWPGNVRELINVVERSLLLCNGDAVRLEDLPDEISQYMGAVSHNTAGTVVEQLPKEEMISDAWLDRPWRDVRQDVLENAERAYLIAVLKKTNGKVGDTAKLAGIQPRSLYEKMRLYGLKKENFKPGNSD